MWRKAETNKAAPTSAAKEPAPVAAPTLASENVPSQITPHREATAPTSHLTSSLVIRGEISGRDDLLVDGEVHGKIRIQGARVTIGPKGRVTADVEAREIVVRGSVTGNLHGHERVQVGQTGQASGDVVTQRILIEEGAELRGRVEIARTGQQHQANGEHKAAQKASSTDLAGQVATPANANGAASVS